MREERRGQQNSTSAKSVHLGNNSTETSGNKWKDGTSLLNRWQRISLRAQKKNSDFSNLLTHVNEESLLEAFKERVESYGLQINEDKSKTIKFAKGGNEQFNFLGFTFYWGRQNKKQTLKVKTEKSKLIKSIREFYEWIKSIRNKVKLKTIWKLAQAKLRGHYNYFGYWMNRRPLVYFYVEAVKAMFKWLNRRSQKKSYSWQGFFERNKNFPLGKPPTVMKLKQLGRSFGYVQT